MPPLPRLLSETGFSLTPSASLFPYSPQYPLWSDGASKRRWVSIPAGEAIDGRDPDDWVMPAGTRFWKEFSFPERGRVETRYLEKLPNGSFRLATYVWDSALGDAVLAPSEGVSAAHALGEGVSHDIPSHSDCLACHEGRPGRVLGFNALQLSSARDPLAPHSEPLPPGALDLRGLLAQNLLRNFPSDLGDAPIIAASKPSARAAQGYLFGNCSGCHNQRGPLAELGLDFDRSLRSSDAVPNAVGQASRFRLPNERASLRLAPGRPEQSAVWFRIQSRDPLAQMPPLGSKLVDPDGSALIRRWISRDLEQPQPGK